MLAERLRLYGEGILYTYCNIHTNTKRCTYIESRTRKHKVGCRWNWRRRKQSKRMADKRRNEGEKQQDNTKDSIRNQSLFISTRDVISTTVIRRFNGLSFNVILSGFCVSSLQWPNECSRWQFLVSCIAKCSLTCPMVIYRCLWLADVRCMV